MVLIKIFFTFLIICNFTISQALGFSDERKYIATLEDKQSELFDQYMDKYMERYMEGYMKRYINKKNKSEDTTEDTNHKKDNDDRSASEDMYGVQNNDRVESQYDKYLKSESEKELAKKSKMSRFLSKSFSGSVGYATDVGNESREITLAELKFENESAFHKLVLEGESYEQTYKIEAELIINNLSTNINEISQRSVEYSASKTLFKEAYLDVKPFDFMKLSAGNKKYSWGQGTVSLTDIFTSPYYVSRNFVSADKDDYKIPTPQASIFLFPSNKMSLEGYYFPKFILDPALEKINKDTYGTSMDDLVVVGKGRLDGQNGYTYNGSSSKDDSFGAKIMFYPESINFGFSYYNGYNQFLTYKKQIIALEDNNGGNVEFIDNRELYDRVNIYGFEFSKSFSKWTFATDLSIIEKNITFSSVYDEPQINVNNLTVDQREALSHLLDENNGHLYSKRKTYLGNMEFSYNGDKWKNSFLLFFITSPEDGSYNKNKEAFEKVFDMNGDDDGMGELVLPTIFLKRHFGAKQEVYSSVMLGYIYNGMGANLTFGKDGDHVSIYVSAGMVDGIVEELYVEELESRYRNLNNDQWAVAESEVQPFIDIGIKLKF